MQHRKIIHIDMDCFFAAVECLDNPSLKGLPLAVGHDVDRGVVSTASYEARKYGVHSAQSIRMAKLRCPHIVIVSPRIERYKEISDKIRSIFYRYTDIIEPISLDEAFLDVTTNKLGETNAVDIANEIRNAIYNELHLTSSAGVSYCKMLAKIASDTNKPNGICVIRPDNALSFLDNLKIEKLWMVGPRTAQEMHSLGIFTVKQLRSYSETSLTRLFGKRGKLFYEYSRGIDNSVVETYRERKSVSCETTFSNDISLHSTLIIKLYHIVIELISRIEKSKFKGHTLCLKIKFADFTQITRSITTDTILTTKAEILPLAKQLLSKVEIDANHPIRLMGIGVEDTNATANVNKSATSKYTEQFLPFVNNCKEE